MPLELIEYQVFRNSNGLTREVDGPQVPAGQVYRVSHLSVAIYYPKGSLFSLNLAASPAPPQVGVYDVANPGPAVLPCQVTTLSPFLQNGFVAGAVVDPSSRTAYYDVDDDAGITLQPGNQLAVVFYDYWTGPGTNGFPLCSVRAEFEVYQGTAGQPQPAAGLTPGPEIPVAI